MNEISGNAADSARRSERYAIVASRFNRRITDLLIAGARRAFERHGVDAARLDCIWVAGAFEIPTICKKLQASEKYAAMVALGSVIRGETPHFDYIAGECARGIAQLNLQGAAPIIFGVLTTHHPGHAEQRASMDDLDRGGAAAVAALEMADLMRRL